MQYRATLTVSGIKCSLPVTDSHNASMAELIGYIRFPEQQVVYCTQSFEATWRLFLLLSRKSTKKQI